MRRVVIGRNMDGISLVVADERLAGDHLPGAGHLWRLWSADTLVSKDSVDPDAQGMYPVPGGIRFSALEIPPNTEALPEISATGDDARAVAAHRFKEAGMHQTVSIDFDIVVSGKILLEVGDGTKTLLHPGDVIINNGAKHKWSNPGEVPAILAGVVIGLSPC
jgi:hypothetical protein